MKRKYDLFEKTSDGLSLWRDSVIGFELTRRRLQALAQISENQYYAIDLTTGEVLAFLSERSMLTDSTHFQKLKEEARAMLFKYGENFARIADKEQSFGGTPEWFN